MTSAAAHGVRGREASTSAIWRRGRGRSVAAACGYAERLRECAVPEHRVGHEQYAAHPKCRQQQRVGHAVGWTAAAEAASRPVKSRYNREKSSSKLRLRTFSQAGKDGLRRRRPLPRRASAPPAEKRPPWRRRKNALRFPRRVFLRQDVAEADDPFERRCAMGLHVRVTGKGEFFDVRCALMPTRWDFMLFNDVSPPAI